MQFRAIATNVAHMHPEVAKLVEAGRINAAVGERLSQVAPGSYLLSKSWGAGKVVSWSLRDKKVIVDFAEKSAQEMDLQFVLQKTEPLQADDFRAKKIEQIEELRHLAKTDPVELAAHVLQSHGNSMTLDAFEKELNGPVIPTADFKKWWDAAKKLMAASKRVVVPPRRTDLITLRAGGMSPAQALVADFEAARDLKVKAKSLEAIAAEIHLFAEDESTLRRLYEEIEAEVKRGTRLHLGNVFELLLIRDQMVASSKISLAEDATRLSEVIRAEYSKVSEAISGMSAIRQREVYDAFPSAFGGQWVEKLMGVVEKAGARGLGEIAKIFEARGELSALEDYLRRAITRRSLGHEALIWVCRERESSGARVFSADVGAAILNQLESDFIADGPRKSQRLQSLLGEDKELLSDLVSMMDVNEARNFGRRLMECPVFNDLDKKSLMARVIKARPETETLVSGEDKNKEEELLVSWSSLEARRVELQELVSVRIPQNREDVKIARSYGDLRENFEYKSAKDMEKYLNSRRRDLERDVARARGTDFKGVDCSIVNIGTVVTLANDKGETYQLSVLGAWDSDPEKRWVSYLSEAGASLLHKKIGDEVQLRDHDNQQQMTWKVSKIEAFAS
ncbi:MAG: GreA/GreB family elongation factor [Akkermansiaceae bacterium]